MTIAYRRRSKSTAAIAENRGPNENFHQNDVEHKIYIDSLWILHADLYLQQQRIKTIRIAILICPFRAQIFETVLKSLKAKRMFEIELNTTKLAQVKTKTNKEINS